jgi:hypothetical protein
MADETTLMDLLLVWEELHEQGKNVSAAELTRDHPHLRAELQRRIEALRAVRWVKESDPGCCSTAAVGAGC